MFNFRKWSTCRAFNSTKSYGLNSKISCVNYTSFFRTSKEKIKVNPGFWNFHTWNFRSIWVSCRNFWNFHNPFSISKIQQLSVFPETFWGNSLHYIFPSCKNSRNFGWMELKSSCGFVISCRGRGGKMGSAGITLTTKDNSEHHYNCNLRQWLNEK